MTQIATVKRLLGTDHALVSVPRKSACGHDCETCAGCGVSGVTVEAKARNPIGAAVGEQVVVEGSTGKVLGIVMLVYLVPIFLFLLGYFATEGLFSAEGPRYVAAAAGFVLGIVPALVYDRRVKRNGGIAFTIVRRF